MFPASRSKVDTMGDRIAFIRAHVGGDRECVILAEFQAVYFAETGFKSAMNAPGLTEMFFKEDLETIRSALILNPVQHLFVDTSTSSSLQIDETLKARYKTVSTSPDGKLKYMEPIVD